MVFIVYICYYNLRAVTSNQKTKFFIRAFLSIPLTSLIEEIDC